MSIDPTYLDNQAQAMLQLVGGKSEMIEQSRLWGRYVRASRRYYATLKRNMFAPGTTEFWKTGWECAFIKWRDELDCGEYKPGKGTA